MSGPLVSASAAFVAKNSRIPPFAIEQSLRFNKADTPYLNKVFTSAGDEQKFTISFWFKTTNVGNSTASNLAGAGDDGSNYFLIDIEKASVGEFLHIFNYTPSTGYEFDLKTTRLLRDPSAWMHLVLAVDTTQATASDRAKVWLNGVRETSFTTENYPNQNRTTMWWGGNTSNGIALANQETAIGRRPPGGPEYANAYIAEFNSIDGQYLTHEDFGEFDDNGVWRPIKYTGTYTGNSFYLKFDAADVDGDSSGLGNDFTANNFTTSGTGTDVMSDTPTTNWATLNPIWNSVNATYAEGNLQFTGGSTHSPSASTISASSGKYYFEAKALSGSAAKWSLGIIDTAIGYRKSSGNNYIPGLEPTSIYSAGDAISLYNNNIYKNGSSIVSGVFSGGAVAAGDVVQMAVDIDAGKIWFGIDGTWNNGGGTEGAFNPSGHDATFAANDDYIFHFTAESCGWTVNFGQRDFEQTVPTGFSALNTSNLSAPDIADGSEYFNTVLYTGNGSTQSITGVGFQPDWVWAKSRDTAYGHWLGDVVRGGNERLASDATQEGRTNEGNITFDTDGFSVTSSHPSINDSSDAMVAWNWLAGGSVSADNNTDGDIPSTVSANPTSGFSIVTWTGTGADGSYGHGLGVKPAMIIHKRRDSTSDWHVWHQGLPTKSPTNDVIYLNLTDAQNGGNSNLFRLDPTSSLIYTGSAGSHNVLNGTYVDYVFAEVEGYSKFGSYTGNGSTDGPFVYCGFRPSFLLFKRSSAAEDWVITDSVRRTYNQMNGGLRPNSSAIEWSTDDVAIDFTANGFKIKSGDAKINASGSTYIFMALAENPMGGSGISPATAR